MAKEEVDYEECCGCIGKLLIFLILISGPIYLIDGMIFFTTGGSIWYGTDVFTNEFPVLYIIWISFIWGVIITVIDIILLFRKNEKLGYLSLYAVGGIPAFLISVSISIIVSVYITISYYVLVPCALLIRKFKRPTFSFRIPTFKIPSFHHHKNIVYLFFYILGGIPVFLISGLVGFIVSIYVTIGYYAAVPCVLILRYIIKNKSFTISIRIRNFFSFSRRVSRRRKMKYRNELEEIFPVQNLFSHRVSRTMSPAKKNPKLSSFEAFMRSAKKLIKEGKEFYKRKEYQKAVKNWQEALKQYELGLTKKINKTQREQLEKNVPIIIQDIAHCLLEKANHHKKKGERHLSKHKLQEAEKEMKKAVQDFTNVKTKVKSHDLSQIEIPHIDENLKYLEINLQKVNIEKIIEKNEKTVRDAENLKKDNLTDAIKKISDVCKNYLELKNNLKKNKEMAPLMKKIDKKIIETREMQEEYRQSFDELIGITPATKPVSLDIPRSEKVANKRSVDIKREYDFVSGEVRFRIALKNLMESTITNIQININIPPSLRWVIHEPRYPKKGDTVEIPKLGAQEKASIAIYLAPISCLEGQINATITYFDSYNNPHALTMEPKTVAITCPIFFTSQTANLARVKNLYEHFSFRQTKLYPIIKKSKIYRLFEVFIKILNEFDIKMVLREYNKDTNEGEAWFYGETKVKKNHLVIHISTEKNFELIQLEVGGNTQEQVTSFLAEINSRIKEAVLKKEIFDKTIIYNDIKTSILSYVCPYCGDEILEKTVRTFIDGDRFQCRYCNIAISTRELNILDR